MNYKSTINLPRTPFPMKANMLEKQEEILRRWQAQDIYHSILEDRRDAQPFIIHDGPPYACFDHKRLSNQHVAFGPHPGIERTISDGQKHSVSGPGKSAHTTGFFWQSATGHVIIAVTARAQRAIP
jgi:hypothetical protein